MADNVAITAGAGTTVAADDVGGVMHQRVKISLGADAAATDALGGAGAVAAGVQRTTLASDDPLVTAAGAVTASPTRYTLADRLRKAGRLFAAAASTLTRPANTTAYTAGDSISNSATAGSVTALPATVSADNDDPVTVERITVETTDTGLGGKSIAVHVFNSDPTTSSGVVAGDNVAWSNKRAGYLGRFEGTFRTFSDGAVATLVPSEGSRLVCKPGSGGTTLWVQFQTLSDFTPSANSTTLIATLRGAQGVD